jgi:hypothetical protein
MKRYTYNILVAGKNSECFSTKEVSAFINSAVGVPIVSTNMILNYFSRPHLVNKRLFHSNDDTPPVIQLRRAETITASSSPEV